MADVHGRLNNQHHENEEDEAAAADELHDVAAALDLESRDDIDDIDDIDDDMSKVPERWRPQTDACSMQRLLRLSAGLLLAITAVVVVSIVVPLALQQLRWSSATEIEAPSDHAHEANDDDDDAAAAATRSSLRCTTESSLSCVYELVQSFPLESDAQRNREYANERQHTTTAASWLSLIRHANRSIDIAQMYVTLRPTIDNGGVPARDDLYSEAERALLADATRAGQSVFDELVAAAARGVVVRIVHNAGGGFEPDDGSSSDTATLVALGAASVRALNFTRVARYAGVLHTKLMVLDGHAFYVGSANADWRSLSLVKELGISFRQCACLALDAQRLFELYWSLADESLDPEHVAELVHKSRYAPTHTLQSPGDVRLGRLADDVHATFLSVAPPSLAPTYTDDLMALVDGIRRARRYLYISVMDYEPRFRFVPVDGTASTYWDPIDTALRAAVNEQPELEVRMLISHWQHSNAAAMQFLHSLAALERISVRIYEVEPLLQVPFTRYVHRVHSWQHARTHSLTGTGRVNHAKYYVTDNKVFIGTSNWSADYFVHTAGASVNIAAASSTELNRRVTEIFMQDWESPRATPLESWRAP